MYPAPGFNAEKILLNTKFRIVGMVITVTGVLFSYLHFGRGIKPDFLETKVFAIYSSYFDTKYFQVIPNNISEELCGILLLTGLFLIAFAREKKEEPHFNDLRFKALILTFYSSAAILFFSFIFIFGLGFMKVVILNIYIPLVLYILLFRYQLFLDRKIRQQGITN